MKKLSSFVLCLPLSQRKWINLKRQQLEGLVRFCTHAPTINALISDDFVTSEEMEQRQTKVQREVAEARHGVNFILVSGYLIPSFLRPHTSFQYYRMRYRTCKCNWELLEVSQ